MQAAVQQLLDWVPQLIFYRSSLRSDAAVQAMLASTGVTADAIGALHMMAAPEAVGGLLCCCHMQALT